MLELKLLAMIAAYDKETRRKTYQLQKTVEKLKLENEKLMQEALTEKKQDGFSRVAKPK